MFIIISPAKSLNFQSKAPNKTQSEIRLSTLSKQLAKVLKKKSPDDLIKLMKISSNLADLNYGRFQEWNHPFDNNMVKAALWAFTGEVFNGMQACTFNDQDIDFSQDKLRILSGFYGLLRPNDNILPYRLEMGTKLETTSGKNLYQFWGDTITNLLKEDMDNCDDDVLINLASNEYFKAVNKKVLNKRIISPVFKDAKNGDYKVISIYAKKARGMMTRFIVKNKLSNPDDIIAFNEDGYYYHEGLSKKDHPVFVRDYPGGSN